MTEDLQLLQILNARIVRDLAGSIGTVDNCLSLIDTTTKTIGKQAKALAIEECGNLVKKLNFFCGVYCSSGGDDQISVVYLTKLLKDFFSTSEKVELDLDFEGGVIYLDALLAKASLCLIMLVSEQIYVSGKITFSCGNDKNNNFIRITSNAKDIRSNDKSLEILNDRKTPEINIGNCREYYINALCDDVGYRVFISKKGNNLEYNLLKV